MNNNPSSKGRYAVFGNPIGHSKSPSLQMAFAHQTHQDMIYTAQCVDIDKFDQTADDFFEHGGLGLNITVPFKIQAFTYADRLTVRAQKAGAVNTLIKSGDNIIGDNTDGVGFVYDVEHNLQWPLENKSVLVLGAGGAVRGILQPLLKAGVGKVLIANRTQEKAQQLADDFSEDGNIASCHYSDLVDYPQGFDIIVNGTSASLSGNLPELPDNIIHPSSCCYDMMYEKGDTVFMRWAKQQGTKYAADGVGMLVSQGAESFYQWRKIRPETKAVIQKIKSSL